MTFFMLLRHNDQFYNLRHLLGTFKMIWILFTSHWRWCTCSLLLDMLKLIWAFIYLICSRERPFSEHKTVKN